MDQDISTPRQHLYNSYHHYQTVDEIQKSLQNFGTVDVIVFIFMLVICAIIGIYYAIWGKKGTLGTEEEEYLMGGRNMRTVPVALSLIASFISGITLLGTPTELYIYGTEYLFIFIGVFIMALFVSKIYLPVFHDLQLSSTYEYLDRRFNNKVRLFGSFLFTLSQVCWLPIVIYVPALAFNQVTGINVHIVTPLVCLVCIFYTCVGGLKAVVWTDVVQTVMMFLAMFVVMIKGTMDIGGLGVVLDRNWNSGRLTYPSFNPDPTLRYSMLAVVLGQIIHWSQSSVLNQNMVQRYLSLPNKTAVNRALWIFVFGATIISLVCGYSGLLAYATYHDCDPLTTGLARAKDQLFPLLVMKVLGHYPGMTGLFVAGVFSAALSSLSTGLNSMSAVTLEDFCKPFFGKMTQFRKNVIMKGIVVVFGLMCVALVFVVEKLGSVLQLSISLSAATYGPAFGLFTCGVLIPWVNSKGALTGALVGTAFSSFIIFGAQEALASGRIVFPTKPTSVEGCDYIYQSKNLSWTNVGQFEENEEAMYVFPLFKVSYLWYTAIGTVVTILVAVLFSYLTGFNNPKDVDPGCISPVIRNKWFPVVPQEEEPNQEKKPASACSENGRQTSVL